ncbi:MAG: caspase family protein, partial [Cyclobacteriaceae bacterium]|nr:caspase family protein [Cyclobacteriaceae bacterium]
MKSITHTLILMTIQVVCLYGQDIVYDTPPVYLNHKSAPPVLAWLNPLANDDTLAMATLNLKVGINSESEITAYNVALNDLPVGRANSYRNVDDRVHNFDMMLDQPLVLKEGPNKITVLVKNARGKEVAEDRTVYVKLPEQLIVTSTRKDYALLFATDEYQEWTDLNNPLNDARTIGKELEENYGFEVELVENASKEEVLIKLREYAQKKFERDDQLFVFFAGHGHFDEVLRKGFLVAKDSKRKDESFMSYISHADLRETIDRIRNRHIFMAMDVCFGGTFDPLLALTGTRGMDDGYNQTKLEYINRKLEYQTRKYLTSGGKNYVSDGIPGQHSPFAHAFLNALRSYGGNDGVLTLGEVKVHLDKLRQQPRSGSFGQDEPGSD